MAETEVLQAVAVIYCGKCGMPPEYCEYGPDFESHCDPWLRKNHPDLHSTLKALRCVPADGKNTEDDDEEEETNRPTAPWTTEERLTAFYEKYQPDKVSDVPTLLEKYAGKEDKLFIALTKKYGPEPDDPYYDEDSDEDDLEERINFFISLIEQSSDYKDVWITQREVKDMISKTEKLGFIEPTMIASKKVYRPTSDQVATLSFYKVKKEKTQPKKNKKRTWKSGTQDFQHFVIFRFSYMRS